MGCVHRPVATASRIARRPVATASRRAGGAPAGATFLIRTRCVMFGAFTYLRRRLNANH